MIKRVPNIVTVLTFTLITLLFWIAFSAYRLIVTPASTIEVPQEILEPLDPNLDQQLLQDASARLYLDEGLIQGYIESYESTIESTQLNQRTQETEFDEEIEDEIIEDEVGNENFIPEDESSPNDDTTNDSGL